MTIRQIRNKVVRELFSSFYKKVVNIHEEWMQGDKIGRRRKIDVLELECGHKFWQEKGDSRGVEERLCDVCLSEWLYGDAYKGNSWLTYNIVVRIMKAWDEKWRRRLTE